MIEGTLFLGMPNNRRLIGCSFLALLFFVVGCAAPQRFWPQKDIDTTETVAPEGSQVVLIASRTSEFKKRLVERLQQQLAADGFAHKTIGVDGLAQVDASEYASVVVINTCLAWGLDHEVRTFLDRQKTDKNVALLTTSGSGAWLPEKEGGDFDAISAASQMTTVDTVVEDVMAAIRAPVNGP